MSAAKFLLAALGLYSSAAKAFTYIHIMQALIKSIITSSI